MRALVCGSRTYDNRDVLWNNLDGFGPPEITEVISGMARGADSLAAEWAERFGFTLHKFPAQWNKYGRRAGPIRNQQMLDEGKPDVVIAFPTGGKLDPKSGTADMVRRAEKAGVKVVIIG